MFFSENDFIPHVQGLPFSKLFEEVKWFDSIKRRPLLEPVVERQELFGCIIDIKAQSFLTYGEVLVDVAWFLLFLENPIVDYFKVIWILLVGIWFFKIHELIDMCDIFKNHLNVTIELIDRAFYDVLLLLGVDKFDHFLRSISWNHRRIRLILSLERRYRSRLILFIQQMFTRQLLHQMLCIFHLHLHICVVNICCLRPTTIDYRSDEILFIRISLVGYRLWRLLSIKVLSSLRYQSECTFWLS